MSRLRSPVGAAACRALRPLRNRYQPPDTAAKLRVLQAIATRGVRVRSFALLAALHEDLLFLRAFPDSTEVCTLANAALRRIEPALRRLAARQRALADDSGMAGSVTRYTHPYGIARWLAARWPLAAEVDWRAMQDTTRLDAFIGAVLQRAEDDAFEAGDLDTREWLDLARDRAHEGALAWMLASAGHSRGRGPAFGRLYDAAQVPVRWSLAQSPESVTHHALPVRTVVTRTAMRRPAAHAGRELARPLAGIRLLAAREGARAIDVARAALAARCREVFAITNANPAEVWMAPLGEGAELAVIGVAPGDRLSLESNYGYLLLSNGIPIGYGGVTPLFRQANTGINVFDPFRGSEAAFLWTQMLRAFHSLFGVTRFVVNAAQFGEDNEEAIASGAYWFYWRLGFRSLDRGLRRRAEHEAARRAAEPGRRSSPTTLRHFATGDLHLVLPGAPRGDCFDEAWLTTCSTRVTAMLEQECPHDHALAATRVARRVERSLGVRLSAWSANERAAFVRLAPVVAQLGSLSRWSATDRAQLAALMRAKGGVQERDFVARAMGHRRFFPELRQLLRRWSTLRALRAPPAPWRAPPAR